MKSQLHTIHEHSESYNYTVLFQHLGESASEATHCLNV